MLVLKFGTWNPKFEIELMPHARRVPLSALKLRQAGSVQGVTDTKHGHVISWLRFPLVLGSLDQPGNVGLMPIKDKGSDDAAQDKVDLLVPE